jgi:hypothetical protein
MVDGKAEQRKVIEDINRQLLVHGSSSEFDVAVQQQIERAFMTLNDKATRKGLQRDRR